MSERNNLRSRENESYIIVYCSNVGFTLQALARPFFILTFAWPFIVQSHDNYNVTQSRQVAPEWLDPYVLGRYLLDIANDVFNGMEVVTYCRLTTLRACVAWRWVVGPSDTVAVHREWATDWRYTIATYCEWPVDRRCPIAVLQTPCYHVLLVFNVSPAASISALSCSILKDMRISRWEIMMTMSLGNIYLLQ
jgi:hypothetical protein